LAGELSERTRAIRSGAIQKLDHEPRLIDPAQPIAGTDAHHDVSMAFFPSQAIPLKLVSTLT